MGELIVLKDWIAKKEEEELQALEEELRCLMDELDVSVDHVIFAYAGNPVVIGSVNYQSIFNAKI